MAPLKPPRRKGSGKRASLEQQHSSGGDSGHRAAWDGPRERTIPHTRQRLDSEGSTRGAFYHETQKKSHPRKDAAAQPASNNKRKGHHGRTPAKKGPKPFSESVDMAVSTSVMGSSANSLDYNSFAPTMYRSGAALWGPQVPAADAFAGMPDADTPPLDNAPLSGQDDSLTTLRAPAASSTRPQKQPSPQFVLYGNLPPTAVPQPTTHSLETSSRTPSLRSDLYGTPLADSSRISFGQQHESISSMRSDLYGAGIVDSNRSISGLYDYPAPPPPLQDRGTSGLYGPALLEHTSADFDYSGSSGQAYHPPPNNNWSYQDQLTQMAQFSSQALGDYGAVDVPQPRLATMTEGKVVDKERKLEEEHFSKDESVSFSVDDDDDEDEEDHDHSYLYMLWDCLDPMVWLMSDAQFDDDGNPYFDDSLGWTFARVIRHFLYNPEYPEFTSLQQFCWSIIIGIGMGIYTALWKMFIELCVEFVWQIVPAALLNWGFFTDLDGYFPLPHYMWMVPSVFGGVLSYIFAVLPTPIPGQNEWINALHSRGVQSHETFFTLFVLSTLGMASGLSLGPELPLVLTAGMVGSYLGVASKQSVLQARILNITAAGAAVGGFFGFPMAGALFVLEIPHRMGLQYFEALSPATFASIIAVLTNRLVVGNDVTGYYNYPFLTMSLPSKVFTTAIVYGLFGSALGIGYAHAVMYLKHAVHDWFNTNGGHDDDQVTADPVDPNSATETADSNGGSETIPLVEKGVEAHGKKVDRTGLFQRLGKCMDRVLSFGITREPRRAAVAGTIAGFIVGVIGMFVPHVMFWGEAQLQTLIDKGRTPLPVFGEGRYEDTKDITAFGYCLINPNDEAAIRAGFGVGCAAVITTTKILTTGLSLGTGIIGGHFWGPLFVGCAASHFLTDLSRLSEKAFGVGGGLATYPCVAILCIMGSTHVVTFRAHLAIMLILTLTISAFDPENDSTSGGSTAGDYSAVFPLLVVAVFVALMTSRDVVFYASQKSRGDIMALPEVLCEPGKAGAPMILDYEGDYHSSDSSETPSDERDDLLSDDSSDIGASNEVRRYNAKVTSDDIDGDFERMQRGLTLTHSNQPAPAPSTPDTQSKILSDDAFRTLLVSPLHAPSDEQLPPLPSQPSPGSLLRSGDLDSGDETKKLTILGTSAETSSEAEFPSSARLDELLAMPMNTKPRQRRNSHHRRTQSAPIVEQSIANLEETSVKPAPPLRRTHSRTGSFGAASMRERSDSATSSRAGTPIEDRLTVRVTSFGEIHDHQPSLIDQARLRASSMHRRVPSLPRGGRHSRRNSDASAASAALSQIERGDPTSEDVERSFNAQVDQWAAQGTSGKERL